MFHEMLCGWVGCGVHPKGPVYCVIEENEMDPSLSKIVSEPGQGPSQVSLVHSVGFVEHNPDLFLVSLNDVEDALHLRGDSHLVDIEEDDDEGGPPGEPAHGLGKVVVSVLLITVQSAGRVNYDEIIQDFCRVSLIRRNKGTAKPLQEILTECKFERVKWELSVVDESVAGDEVVRRSSQDGDEVVCGHLGCYVHPGVLVPVEQSFDECCLPSGVLAHGEEDRLGLDIRVTDGRVSQHAEESLHLEGQQVFVVSSEELRESKDLNGNVALIKRLPWPTGPGGWAPPPCSDNPPSSGLTFEV